MRYWNFGFIQSGTLSTDQPVPSRALCFMTLIHYSFFFPLNLFSSLLLFFVSFISSVPSSVDTCSVYFTDVVAHVAVSLLNMGVPAVVGKTAPTDFPFFPGHLRLVRNFGVSVPRGLRVRPHRKRAVAVGSDLSPRREGFRTVLCKTIIPVKQKAGWRGGRLCLGDICQAGSTEWRKNSLKN